MSVLEPELAILDETDSGLDIDALKDVAEGINKLRTGEKSLHNCDALPTTSDYIVPDLFMF